MSGDLSGDFSALMNGRNVAAFVAVGSKESRTRDHGFIELIK